MPAVEPRPSPEEIARRGAEIFDRLVRPGLGPEADDKFVAVDLHTAEYELDDDDYTAVMRLRARKPAAEIWLGRVGHPAAHRIRRSV